MERLQHIITKETKIIAAFSLMDQYKTKVLFIIENNKFYGLISAGDIQRAIIKNTDLNLPVSNILRKEKYIVCKDTDPIEHVKELMFEKRLECMPVVNKNKELIKVYSWDDLFNTIKRKKSTKFRNIPLFVMAGGYGSRLKPITNVLPKPLIPLTEKPFIVDIIDGFGHYGMKDIFISLNYKKELIEFVLNTELSKQYQVTYIHEKTPLGTAGSLSLLKEKFKSTFILTNCDILVDVDFNSIYEYHKNNKNMVTMVASLKNINIPYGTIITKDDGELVELKEKPEIVLKINTGVYILEPVVFDYIQNNKFIHITTVIEKMKEDGYKVGVYTVSEGSWIDIGEWPKYLQNLNDK
jgi:dTDP-glucose pyrophosphorylase/predicted transcriptional regulator